MAHGGRAKMTEGGMVDADRPLKSHPSGENPEMEASKRKTSMAPGEMVDQDVESSSDASDMEEDLPKVSERLSLSAQIMKDRGRQMMAKGGMAMKDDELDAPMEDGRDSRGLNAEPVHTMEDDEHDTSDASLVAQIMRERRKGRKDD